MFYRRIEEIATVEPHGTTFVLARYWRSRAAFRRGEPPARTEDFDFLLAATREVIATDAQGRPLTAGGTAVDLGDHASITGIENWRRVTIPVDRRAIIEQAIDAYWPRAEAGGFPEDHSRRKVKRSLRDPHGLLADSRTLIGHEKLVR